MSLSDHKRSVSLICQSCASTEFEHDDEDSTGNVQCAACGRQYTRDELIEANSELIAANVDEVKAEIVADFRRTMQKSFKNSKFIKVR